MTLPIAYNGIPSKHEHEGYEGCNLCVELYPTLTELRESYVRAVFTCPVCSLKLCYDHMKDHTDSECVYNIMKEKNEKQKPNRLVLVNK